MGDLGRDPPPGALLAGAAPERFGMLVRAVAAKLPEVFKRDAYIRSSMARCWAEFLGRLAEKAASDRHNAALRAR